MNIARAIWATVLVALLGLPVFFALRQRVPNINDFEMTAAPTGAAPTFAALGATTNDDGSQSARKSMWQASPYSLLAHDEVRLRVVTYGARLQLLHAEIRVPGTSCLYQTPSGAAIVNTGLLAFQRAAACRQVDGDHRELELTVTYRGNGRVGFATFPVAPSAIQPHWLMLSAPDAADPRPIAVLRGRYVDDLGGAGLRRIDLLGRMWQIGDSPEWIWLTVGAALTLLWIGIAFVAAPSAPAPWWPAAMAAGSLALGLALLYSVLVPPLQAPDEPDHLLAFAQLTARPALADNLATFARRNHFARIHFHPDERFRPADINTPSATAWDPAEVFAHDVAGRSSTTALWWRGLAPLLANLDAGHVILAIRVANGLVFAACFAVAAALLLWTSRSRAPAPHGAALALLLIPTLPFFATHVSEFALMMSAYVILAAAMAALFMDGERVHWLGLPIGIAASCVLTGGRSGLPYAAILAAAFGGRALLGSHFSDSVSHTRRSLIFWGGLALGLALFPFLSTAELRDGLWPADAGLLPARFRAVAELLRRNPWSVGALIPIALAVELLVTSVRRRLPEEGRWAARLVTGLLWVAGMTVVASLVSSAFWSYPTLLPREIALPSSLQAYVSDVLKVVATSFRLVNHDWLLAASFWGGFGWLETSLSDGVITIPVVLTSIAVLGTFRNLTGNGRLRRVIWLAVLGGGWVTSIILYAGANYFLNRNLHGRYLVGLYLSMLATMWGGALIRRQTQPTSSSIRWFPELSLVSVIVIIHAWAMCVILLRYF